MLLILCVPLHGCILLIELGTLSCESLRLLQFCHPGSYYLFLQFYFGDQNLPRDKFMQQTIAANEGVCILSTINEPNFPKKKAPI